MVQKVFRFLVMNFLLWFALLGCQKTETPEEKPTHTIELVVTQEDLEIEIPTLPIEPTVPSPEPTLIETPDALTKTVIAFTGVIVPARCVQEEVSKVGGADYIYEEVREMLDSADIAVGVYNATMRDDVPYMGCVKSWELIGSTNNADALGRAGFDLMSVATNHIKDCGHIYCGDDGFFSTLEHLNRVGIRTVGAGENLSEALEPVVIEANGIRFGFVSLGDINEKVFADQAKAGIAYLSSRNLESAISAARNMADIVIVLPHSGPEDYPEVTPQQNYWARHSIQYGADLVVMTHAHVLQGYEMIEGVPVFYSLGNFVFDQSWARDHQQGAILLVEFEGENISSLELVPTIVDEDGTVHQAEETEREQILDRIKDLSEILLQDE